MQLKSVVLGALLGGALVWALTSGVVSVDPSAAPAGFGGNSTETGNDTSNSSWVDLVGGALAPDELNDTRVEQLIVEYVNQERVSRGVAKVADSPEISEAADGHASNMAKHDYVGHDQPNGETPRQRYASICGVGGGAENVNAAYYQTEFRAYGTDETIVLTNETEVAHYLVDSWMRSDGHRRNILDSHAITGVGVNVSESGKVYATQAFC